MKYSKQERELAAVICAIAASTPDLDQSYRYVWAALEGRDPFEVPALHRPAYRLALAAWTECWRLDRPDAEAEALIRMGWTP